jgi:hypothetical protein
MCALLTPAECLRKAASCEKYLYICDAQDQGQPSHLGLNASLGRPQFYHILRINIQTKSSAVMMPRGSQLPG